MPSTNQNIDNQFGGNFDPSGNESSNTGVNELGQVDSNANVGSGTNLNTNFIENSSAGTGYYVPGETNTPDLGALDWDELESLWNSGGLWDYTESEFGLSEDYKQYITPISQEPFDIIQAMSKNKLFGAGLGARKQLNTIEGQADSARNKSNLAYSGTVESAVNQSKDLLFKDYQSTTDSIGTQTRQSIFDEEQRQLERFYDDIGAVLQYGVIKDGNDGDNPAWYDLDPSNDGTSFICGQIKKSGNMKKIESLKMMKFLLKSAITHPIELYWYTIMGKVLINKGNNVNFNWSSKTIKRMFVSNIIKLEENGNHNKAVSTYINNCLKLAEMLGLSIVGPPFKYSISSKIKGWWKLFTKKQTWEFGIPYLRTYILNRKVI